MLNTRRAAASLLAVLAVAPVLAHAAVPDEQGIRQTLARYEEALNASDTAKVLALYTAHGVQMAPDAPAAVGIDAVRAAYEGTFRAIALQLKFSVDEIQLLGQQRALLRTHSTGTVKVHGADQAAAPASFKELFLLQQQPDGQWKFTHYSFSAVPVSK